MNEPSPCKRSVVPLVALVLAGLVLIGLCIALFVSRRGLEQRLADSNSQARMDEELITTLTARLKSAQDLAWELKQTMDRLNEELNQAKDDLRRQQAAADKATGELKQENSRLQLQIASLKEEIADLKEQIASLEEEIAGLKEQIASLEEEIAGLKELLEKRRHEPFRNVVGIWMVPIIDGKFQMGSPLNELGRDENEVQHLVRLTKPFYLAVHEVTQEQYFKVMNNRPWEGKVENNEPDYPATFVSWDQAEHFCEKLTKMANIPGVRYHLPTEAQWEYACRAGTKTPFWFGLAAPAFGGLFECLGKSDLGPQPVGSKRANKWGLFDMHGNVDEWCQDWFGPLDNQEAVNPTGPGMGLERVIRGGTINLPPGNARSARRNKGMAGDIRSSRGFRVARTYDAVPNGR